VATIDLTKDTFDDTILSNEMVLVDFWAAWCGPCRSFAPVYERVSAENPGVVFGKVDTEAERELAGYFNIRSIPTLMIFRNSIGIFAQPGALPEAALTDLIEQARDVDMDDVRRQIAEESDTTEDHQHDHEGEHVHDDAHDHAQ
jgi:thioredoxin 1